jgi:hypothetical protein
MAEKYERYRRSSRESQLRLPKPAIEKQPTTYDTAKQAEGLKKRIEGSGIDVEKVTDTRNFVEKTFNLSEKQNFFFDVFEVLGRPQQALFNAIKSLQEGESFGKGFKDGLTGKEYVKFAEILNEAGIGEENAFGLDDVLGFAGDIFLDPADLAILTAGVVAAPVTGGASTAGAVTAVNTLNTVQNVGQTTAKAAKLTNEIMDVAKASGKVAKKSAEKIVDVMKTFAKATGKMYKEIGKELVKNPLKGAKLLFSSKDIVLESGERIIRKSITNLTMDGFRKTVKLGGKSVDFAVRAGLSGSASAVKNWDDFLKATQGLFNKAARLGDDSLKKVKGWIGHKSGGRLFGDYWVLDVKKKIKKIADDVYDKAVKEAEAIGEVFTKTKEEVFEQVNKSLLEYGELNLSPETTLSEVLNNPYRWELPIDSKVRKHLADAINNPVFKSVKSTFEESPMRRAFYTAKIGEIKKGINDAYKTVTQDLEKRIEDIKLEATNAAQQAGKIVDKPVGEAGADFVQSIKDGKTVKEIKEALGKKVVDQKSVGEVGTDFVEAIRKGAKAEDVRKVAKGISIENILSPEQVEEIKQLTEQIDKIKKTMQEISNLGDSYKDIDAVRKRVNDLIASDAPDEVKTAIKAVMDKVEKEIADESLNIVDELYMKTQLDNGKEIWVLRHDLDDVGDSVVKKKIDAINKRFKKLYGIVDDVTYDYVKEGRMFIQGSKVETELRNFIKELDNGKTFEDYYELTKTGNWVAIDRIALEDLVKYMRPDDMMEAGILSSRFRTEQEWAALQAKYGADFEYKEQYDEIMNEMEDAMRWYDEKYGTAIKKDTAGYIHHAATKEAKDAINMKYGYKQFKMDNTVVEDTPFIIGNTKAFKGRKYQMSVEEANRIARFNAARMLEYHNNGIYKLDDAALEFWKDKASINMFSEYFTDSFADTLIKMNDYGSAIRIMDEALIRSTLSDKDIIRPVSDVTGQVSKGFQQVNKADLTNKLKSMASVYPDSQDMLYFIDNVLGGSNFTGNVVEIDRNVWEMIGRVGNIKKDIPTFVKIMDLTNKTFKKLKIFSAGFHFKNLIGNASNLFLAGVSVRQLPKILINGMSDAKTGKKLMKIFVEGGEEAIKKLPQKLQDKWKVYQVFINAGFEDAGKYLYDLDNLFGDMTKGMLSSSEHLGEAKTAFKGKKVVKGSKESIDAALQLNVEINQIVDSGYRLGYLEQLMKDGVPAEEAVQKVKLALFDPSDITGFEKDVARRIIPFYTFTKKNLAYQMRNVFENPIQYKRFIRSINATWDAAGVDFDKEVQDYQKENMWIPIPLTLKDGKYLQLRTSFPVSDLSEFISNPATKILSSMSPYIKAPFEYSMNREIYSGLDIERFQGQEGRTFPALSAKGEYIFSQTGLDRPAVAVKNVYELLKKGDVRGSLPTVMSEGNVETAVRSKAYDDLNQLRDLLKYFKQEKIPILTLAEIENLNKSQANLSEKLRQIQSRRGR